MDYLHEVEHAAARIERLERAIDQAVESLLGGQKGPGGGAAGVAGDQADHGGDDRGGAGRGVPLRAAEAADGLQRHGLERGLYGEPDPALRDHQDGQRPPEAGRRRGGLGLPVPPSDVAGAQEAAGRAERGGQGDRLEGSAPAVLPVPTAAGEGQAQAGGDHGGGPGASGASSGRSGCRWRRSSSCGAGAPPETNGETERSHKEKRTGTLERSRRWSRGLRNGGSSFTLCGRANTLIHEVSPRQLPTDHDHDGGPQARSANIRVINRRDSRLDRLLLRSRGHPLPRGLTRSSHIREGGH